ncbi:MAG: LemA family protein [Finegoldia sp.]|nr:LemA family protein [Finegoldia sp.]
MIKNRKSKGAIGPIAIILIVIILLIALIVPTYNSLVGQRENVNSAYAQVENVVQRRADLIPNLVNTVKGYASHEEDALTEVTKARAGISDADNPQELAQANENLTRAIGDLNVVVEKYPDLKADSQFTQLMDELAGTENRISVERKNYTQAVQDYNSTIKRFPKNIIANITGFDEAEYFKADAGSKDAPVVDFNK